MVDEPGSPPGPKSGDRPSRSDACRRAPRATQTEAAQQAPDGNDAGRAGQLAHCDGRLDTSMRRSGLGLRASLSAGLLLPSGFSLFFLLMPLMIISSTA